MGKEGYFVLALLLVFIVSGFMVKQEKHTPESKEETISLGQKDQDIPTQEPKIVQGPKVKILNWLDENIDTMIFSKGVERSIEKVCFANASDVYMWSQDSERKEKWLVSLHETASGLFPEFKAFFAFASNTWELESGEDIHKGAPLDCYLYDSLQWKRE